VPWKCPKCDLKIYNHLSVSLFVIICTYTNNAWKRYSNFFEIPRPGVDPTTESYNATSCLVRLKKTSLFYTEKRSSLLQLRRCTCEFQSRRIGTWSRGYILSIFSAISTTLGQKYVSFIITFCGVTALF
jgi:hypothetical protein